ncbi:MAG: hypothetical protein Q8O56_13550 [Solirubrobacteraceae bacterium]|nr:hypothetical protein [Solirubrobacteraceae bacterium]
METSLILCDHADAANGKLFINGGGWNVLFAADSAVNFSLAILIEVPWDRASVRHSLVAELLTADGDVVAMGDEPVRLAASFELARSPGMKPGMNLNAPIAMHLQGLVLAAGSYEWRLFVGTQQVARKPFQVMAAPGSGQSAT